MTRSRLALRLLGPLALAMACGLAAQSPIQPGVDAFQTPSDGTTFVDLSTNPIPAGFFCAGSPAVTQAIRLVGSPLTTVPAGIAGNADTLFERTTVTSFVGGVAKIPVIARAVALQSGDLIPVLCGTATTVWRVQVCLCGAQTATSLSATVDQACGCGHANGQLQLRVCLTFTRVDTGEVRGPLVRFVTLVVNNMPWCPTAGSGTRTIATSFRVDTNCDGQVDLGVRGTSNFFPGRSCANLALDCWAQFADLTTCHDGPAPDHRHCNNPICGQTGLAE
ncbi:MAG TPA: hypothetical protein PK413_04455 [Thermoanaerobaculia bacterium]|nr:hypothetical protein [Thermoanaerobaculia bacterium]